MPQFILLRIQHHQQPVSLLHRCSHTVFQTGIIFVRRHQLVHHHLHVVVLIAVKLHAGQGFTHLTVYPHIKVALLAHLFKQLFVMPLAIAHQRRQDINLPSFVFAQDKVYNLFLGIFHHFLPRQVRVSLSGTGIEQTQKVINLGSSAHSRTRILVGRLLFDGNDRTKARNLIHVRPLQIPQEIAGIS